MLPEVLVTLLCAVYLGSVIDFRSTSLRYLPVTKAAPLSRRAGVLTGAAGLLLLGAAVFDIVMLAARLQNGETGELDWQALATAPFSSVWLPCILVSGIALLAAAGLLLLRRILLSRQACEQA